MRRKLGSTHDDHMHIKGREVVQGQEEGGVSVNMRYDVKGRKRDNWERKSRKVREKRRKDERKEVQKENEGSGDERKKDNEARKR